MNILFFCPHSFYKVYALPEAVLAESLLQKGGKICYLLCGGILKKLCLCMSHVSCNDSAAKDNVCILCKKISKIK